MGNREWGFMLAASPCDAHDFNEVTLAVELVRQENSTMKSTEISTDNPLEMIWAIREKIYEETKEMTSEEWSNYLREATEWFELEMKRVHAEKQAAIAAGQIVKKPWE
jgi:hypothetical protein